VFEDMTDAQMQDRVVTSLAAFRPFATEETTAQGAITDLVVTVLHEDGGAASSLGAIRDSFRTLWRIEVELDELRDAVGALERAGHVQRGGGSVSLSPEAAAHIAQVLDEAEARERRALDQWRESLKTDFPALDDAELDALESDLQLWLSRVIQRHGVETAMLLYPEREEGQLLLDEIERTGLDFLPGRGGRLAAVRERAFYQFIRQPTPDQRVLLSSLMNASYFLNVLTIDPACTEAVQTLTAGQRIYLDTNFLYRVLALQGPTDFLPARRLLDLTKQLGFQVAVTPWTVAEFRNSLNRARGYLSHKRVPPDELLDLAVNATDDENFITAYWRARRKSPVSVKDFFELWESVEEHLDQLGIQVVHEGCVAVDQGRAEINADLVVLERALGIRDKADPVKEHDVKHLLLVRRLRGEGHRRFSNAGYWFLTFDSLLPRYDLMARGRDGELPFCVSTGAWTQLVRTLTPRTEDYDQTLADLLSSPYVRYRRRVSAQTVQEVVARIDQYKGRTPALAARVLLDSTTLDKVSRTEEEESRLEEIDNAIVAAAESLQEEAEAAARERERAEQERDTAEARVRDLASSIEEHRAEAASLGDAVVEEKSRTEALAAALAEETQRREAAEEARSSADRAAEDARDALQAVGSRVQTLEDQRGQMLKWLRWATGGILIAAGCALMVLVLALSWFPAPVWRSVVTIGFGLIALGGVAIAFGRTRAVVIGGAVSAVVGAVAAVAQLLA
jgi:hypothetical protein